MFTLDLYYHVRPFIPRSLQIAMRRYIARRKRPSVTDQWPILESAGTPPAGWQGWPDGKQFALVLTHDVETQVGHDKCRQLMDLEESLGFRSSFNLVPERYRVDPALRAEMVKRGFEVGVHGLVHDGHLFKSRRIFDTRRPKINGYLKDWHAVGFRSPSTRRNLKWIGELDIEYDSSTFDTDPFEPESEGVHTIFPFIIDHGAPAHPYVELPYTIPQDSTLFLILGEDSPRIWKQKLDWIAERGGMALVNTHPDYMHMDGHPGTGMTYPESIYREFLDHVKTYGDRFWHALPRDLADWVSKDPARVNRRTLRRSCMVAYSFYDSDNRVRRYAETLVRRGDDVEAFGLRQPGEPVDGMLNGVSVSRIQARRRDERGQLGYLARILRFWIKSSAVLAWRHRQRPYDLIHVHSVPDFEVFAAWFPKLLGARVILDIHDIVPEFYASKFGVDHRSAVFRALKWIERASCRFADHVISANHLWHEVLTQRAVAKDKCTVFLNYVDKTIFYPRQRVRKDNRFILIYPGGLQKHQGLDVAIRAMPAIRREVPHAEFHIYGDGNQKEALHTLIGDLHLAQAVFLHREVPLQEVPELMANADLGIVPKLAESFGNEAYSTKILELMSQGLPIVLSRTKIDDYYFDDRTVRFFESGDADGLAAAVVSLAKDSDARAKLVRNASAYLESHYWDSRQQEYLDLVDRLLQARKTTRP
jgi:glycosyltransferase involved in cell wall biosynthesis